MGGVVGVVTLQGADTVIHERLSAEGGSFWDATQTHLQEFGNHGLRTLCLAYRSAAHQLHHTT